MLYAIVATSAVAHSLVFRAGRESGSQEDESGERDVGRKRYDRVATQMISNAPMSVITPAPVVVSIPTKSIA